MIPHSHLARVVGMCTPSPLRMVWRSDGLGILPDAPTEPSKAALAMSNSNNNYSSPKSHVLDVDAPRNISSPMRPSEMERLFPAATTATTSPVSSPTTRPSAVSRMSRSARDKLGLELGAVEPVGAGAGRGGAASIAGQGAGPSGGDDGRGQSESIAAGRSTGLSTTAPTAITNTTPEPVVLDQSVIDAMIQVTAEAESRRPPRQTVVGEVLEVVDPATGRKYEVMTMGFDKEVPTCMCTSYSLSLLPLAFYPPIYMCGV
jgi:hypothetical protein